MFLFLTGAAGSVGSHVLTSLLAADHTVLAADVVPLSPGLEAAIPQAHRSRLTYQMLDLTDYRALDALLCANPGLDGVIHLGAIPSPEHHDVRLVHNNNVSSNYNLLHTCAALGITRIVQASSVNALGLSYTPEGHQRFDELPLTEESPMTPEDAIGELQAAAVCRYYPGLRVASLRFHMCRPTYESALRDARGEDLWAWVSLDACADACLRGLTSKGWTGHEAFNIVAEEIAWEGGVRTADRGSGEMLPSLTLLHGFWQGRYGSVREAWWQGRPRRGFWDCTKAERLLGWKHSSRS